MFAPASAESGKAIQISWRVSNQGELPTDAFNEDARTAIEWTAGQLDGAAREWLAGLPLVDGRDSFTLVHGSPRDPDWEYLFSSSVARANLAALSTPYCLIGHTHVPLCFRESDGRLEQLRPGGAALALDERRAFLNPGSVGQPRDGDPRASAMLLDTERMVVDWLRVEYPIAQVQALMAKAGLPRRHAARRTLGRLRAPPERPPGRPAARC